MKSYHDIEISGERPWFLYGVIGCMALLSLFFILAVGGISLSPWLSSTLLIAGPLWPAMCVEYEVKKDQFREGEYRKYLSTVDINILRLAYASPEFDKKTTACITHFLNDCHPGWTLQND